MLTNVKSSYFSKILFSFLIDRKRLKIAKYNKKLQNTIEINLVNYICFSGRYIIYEEKNRGKEYDSENDSLIFEGEFLNGERNGKGKEYFFYYNEKIKFEGEFLNGEKNGKGKEYYKNGNLKFEGEFLKGKKWNGKEYSSKKNNFTEFKNGKGYIKEYDDYDYLEFEGEYLNGERNGNGKEYYDNGKLEYKGEYFKGKKWNGKGYDLNGKIMYTLKDGKGAVKINNFKGKLSLEVLEGKKYVNRKINDKFQSNIYGKITFKGEFLNGIIWNGKIKEYFGRESFLGIIGRVFDKPNDKLSFEFEGEYKNGYINGKGKEYLDKELLFEGEYLYGWKIKGKEYNDNILIYEGEYLNNKRNGIGKEYNKENGEILFEGEFLKGKIWTGKGKDYNFFGNSLKFQGEYLKGQKWNGTEKKYHLGFLNYDIEYIEGLKKVKKYETNGELLYSIEYQAGEKNGKGKEYYKGEVVFEGEFLEEKRWNGKGKEFFNNGKVKYEGEYLNGKKWNGKGYDFKGTEVYQIINGKGNYKEYDGNGNLKYECEYLNGERNGKGKEYYYWNGKLKFEGEYLNEKRNGKGKEYDSKGNLIYEGEYLNDERNEKK